MPSTRWARRWALSSPGSSWCRAWGCWSRPCCSVPWSSCKGRLSSRMAGLQPARAKTLLHPARVARLLPAQPRDRCRRAARRRSCGLHSPPARRLFSWRPAGTASSTCSTAPVSSPTASSSPASLVAWERLWALTREFYGAARAHLKPGGILSQWLPLHELRRDDVAVALKTVTSMFDHVIVFANRSDAVVLASTAPFRVDPELVARRLLIPEVSGDLAYIGITVDQVLPRLEKPQLSAEEVAALARRVSDLNRDDLPVLEFATARNSFYFNKKLILPQLR